MGRFFLTLSFAAICTAAFAGFLRPSTALAQLPGSILTGGLPAGSELPQGVRRVGNMEIATVTFETKALFVVTGPLIRNRQDPRSPTPVDVRVAQIQQNLQQVLLVDPNRSGALFGAYDTFYDPRSFRVTLARVDDQPVLVAGDREHPNDLSLLTVTVQDARYNGMTQDDLAKHWQRQLQNVLVQALDSRQPDLIRRHLALVPRMAGGLAALSLVLWFGWRALRGWRAALKNSVPSGELDIARIERRLELNSVFLWITASSLVAMWLIGLVWMLSLFPSTAVVAESFWTQLLALVAIWFMAGLLDRLANTFISRFADAWTKSPFLLRDDASRRSLRIPTIVRAVEGFKALLIYLVAAGISLNALGLSTASVLTIGAAVAFAASFAAQSIIKDLTNGLLILAEDQFAMGDIIRVGTVGGIVENLTLRVTQLRDDSGRLITIPNSQISIVENLTRAWSRVDFTVEVAYDSDVDLALKVISQAAQALYDDPTWNPLIVEPPQVLGVESLSHAGVTIRVWIVTVPLQQFPVHREFNRRVRAALQENGIAIGVPQQAVRTAADAPFAAPTPQKVES
jgi:small-conductance mechanosensitive channel